MRVCVCLISLLAVSKVEALVLGAAAASSLSTLRVRFGAKMFVHGDRSGLNWFYPAGACVWYAPVSAPRLQADVCWSVTWFVRMQCPEKSGVIAERAQRFLRGITSIPSMSPLHFPTAASHCVFFGVARGAHDCLKARGD